MREDELRVGRWLGLGCRDPDAHQILGILARRRRPLLGEDAGVEQQPLEAADTFVRALLLDAGVLTDERIEAARKEAEDLMRAGIAAAEAEPPADPELLFTHAYVDPPENMRHG